ALPISDHRAHQAPPAPVTPAAAQGPGPPGAYGHRRACAPGPAAPRQPPAPPPPATPWPPGPPPRGPRPGSRHAPGPAPQRPSAAAAAAHPDAERPPRTSPPAAPRDQACLTPYHTCGRKQKKLRVIYRQALIERVGAELESDGHVPGGTRDDQLMEVAVADDEVPQPAAVDVAALGGQSEQGWVDQELLVPVAVAAGGVEQVG